MKRILVGVSGASGAPLAISFLEKLKQNPKVETHLIITDGAALTIEQETDRSLADVKALADFIYDPDQIWEKPASGSFSMDAMVIIPCSMKTVAGIHSGYAENLLLRAADVCIKEKRKLILVARESPLSPIHLRNLYELSMMGVQILPPMVAYYNHPKTIDDVTEYTVERVLRQLNLGTNDYEWNGEIKL